MHYRWYTEYYYFLHTIIKLYHLFKRLPPILEWGHCISKSTSVLTFQLISLLTFIFKQNKTKPKKLLSFSQSTAHSAFGVLPFNIWTSLKLKFNLVKCALLKQLLKQIKNKFVPTDAHLLPSHLCPQVIFFKVTYFFLSNWNLIC